MAPIARTMRKAFPAVARRSAKALPRRRPASTLMLLGSGDIFDAPERPHEEDLEQPSFISTLQQRYIPSPFCPPADAPYTPSSSSWPSSTAALLSVWAANRNAASAGQSGTATHTPSLLLDGPARPRQRLIVTTRNRHASSSASVPYVPAIPEIFDGPARPRRRSPSQNSKSDTQISPITTVGLIALVGLATYQISRSSDEAQRRAQ